MATRTIERILVANRGEIASRIIRTCKKMGIKTVAVFTEVDACMPFVKEATAAVCIGGTQAYLDADLIIKTAKEMKCDAIHPGYGFLSERSPFARAVEAAGIIFIGPTPESMDAMGLKIGAKKLVAERAPEVPLVPGFLGEGVPTSSKRWEEEAERIGYPVLVKASAGGGGRGMRVVRNKEELEHALDTATTEAQRSFGDSAIMLEKYFEKVRHIEVQIFGDMYGNVVHLLERECSVQRRHQKVIEESPSPFLTPDLRRSLCESAVRVGQTLSYCNAGTVEFIVDPTDARFYFLEVNTRLQVEHPVTELITNLDLVALQILVACGVKMHDALPQVRRDLTLPPLTTSPTEPRGHAIECRLYAEDFNCMPSSGHVALWQQEDAEHCYFHNAVESGVDISVHYDNMISKVVTYDPLSRAGCIRRMINTLQSSTCFGLTTNKLLLLSILRDPDYFDEKGDIHTSWISQTMERLKKTGLDMLTPQVIAEAAAAACVWCTRTRPGQHLRHIPRGWSNLGPRTTSAFMQILRSTHGILPELKGSGDHDITLPVEYQYQANDTLRFSVSGATLDVKVMGMQERPAGAGHSLHLRFGSRAAVFTVLADVRQVNSSDPAPIHVFHRESGLEVSFLRIPKLKHPESAVADEPATRPATQTAVTYVPQSTSQAEGGTAGGSAPQGGAKALKGKVVPSPLLAKVFKINVKNGDMVKKGDVVVVVESMKMETKVHSPYEGKVNLRCKVGDLIPTGKPLFAVE